MSACVGNERVHVCEHDEFVCQLPPHVPMCEVGVTFVQPILYQYCVRMFDKLNASVRMFGKLNASVCIFDKLNASVRMFGKLNASVRMFDKLDAVEAPLNKPAQHLTSPWERYAGDE